MENPYLYTYKDGKARNQPLQEQGFTFSATGSTTTEAPQFVAPTGRGNILGVQVFLGNNTIADLDRVLISIAVNGVMYYQAVPILKFSALYQNNNNEFPLFAEEGATIQVSVVNDQANAIITAVNFLFRPPRS